MSILPIVKEIAHRMKDPDHVREHILSSFHATSPYSLAWSSLTLSHGYPGILLLFVILDRLYPEEKWDLISHQYVIKIKEAIEADGISDLSMFGGLAGICFAIEQASKDNTRYQKFLNSLNLHLFDHVNKVFLEPMQEKFDLALPVYPGMYDTMSGICGIGAYTLNRLECPRSLECLERLLKACINLTRDVKWGHYTLPGWYVPRHYQFTDLDKQIYKKGNFNLGMAHGIPGVLSFLSLAVLKGVVIEDQFEAIKKISDWIYSKRKMLDQVSYWNYRISFEEEILDISENSHAVSMEAWCYGNAGVLRSLYLAGKALKEERLEKTAIEDFLLIPKRVNINPFSTPSFCHGLAGALTLTQLMVNDSGSVELAAIKDQLFQQLESSYNHQLFFGFKDVEVSFLHGEEQRQTSAHDKGGLLDGVSGILLALTAQHTGDFSWARPFLINL